MNRYTIFCTPEQTKKALKLGAPLNSCYHSDDFQNTIKIGNLHYVEIPTAEQMIGWLEEQHVEIDKIDTFKKIEGWDYVIYMVGLRSDIENLNGTFSTRREATIAAIDAALEYLSNK